MAHTIIFFPRGAEVRFSGATNGQELSHTNTTILNHRFEGALEYILVDFSEVSVFDVASSHVERVAQEERMFAETHPPFAVSVAAPRDLIYGLSRMYEAWVEGSGIATNVEKTRAAAIAWLLDRGLQEISA